MRDHEIVTHHVSRITFHAMQYLIDGHNLIARMQTMSLADPDDEAKLVLRLRSWTAASRKRQVTVIFDAGLPAGMDKRLSTSQVTVVFAPDDSTADAVIIKRINKIRNPAEYLIVSSDRAVLAAAAARRVPSLVSEAFAVQLEEEPAQPVATPEPEKPNSSAAGEIEEWLTLFGPVPERQPPPKPVKAAAEPIAPAKPARPAKLTTLKESERKLSSDEVEDWLEIFKKGNM
jgi:predicted RNA-binding protein with PIN domain